MASLRRQTVAPSFWFKYLVEVFGHEQSTQDCESHLGRVLGFRLFFCYGSLEYHPHILFFVCFYRAKQRALARFYIFVGVGYPTPRMYTTNPRVGVLCGQPHGYYTTAIPTTWYVVYLVCSVEYSLVVCIQQRSTAILFDRDLCLP